MEDDKVIYARLRQLLATLIPAASISEAFRQVLEPWVRISQLLKVDGS